VSFVRRGGHSRFQIKSGNNCSSRLKRRLRERGGSVGFGCRKEAEKGTLYQKLKKGLGWTTADRPGAKNESGRELVASLRGSVRGFREKIGGGATKGASKRREMVLWGDGEILYGVKMPQPIFHTER